MVVILGFAKATTTPSAFVITATTNLALSTAFALPAARALIGSQAH